MKFLIGKKIGMTQRFEPDGTVVPVTVLEAKPCVVVDVRTPERDGYAAVRVAGLPTKERRVPKPVRGQFKELGNYHTIREVRVEALDPEVKRGTTIDVGSFAAGDAVSVVGMAKGRGFAGVVKRHHFRGGPASHGHKDNLRMPGSIGATFPQHVLKGTRMGGRMGGQRVTVKGLRVVDVLRDQHLLLVSGAIPGSRNGIVLIQAR